jgi:Fe-S-cluster containining protein
MAAVDAYQELLAQVETLTARLTARYAQHLVCRAGCSGCCQHHLSVFAVEAAAIRQAFDALPVDMRERIERQARAVNERQARGEAVACPLLVDERCAIYAARPLICRTQGLPLLLEVESGEATVAFCPLNFSAPGAVEDLDERQLVPLEALNLKLALANLQHCREQGISPAASGERRRMSEIILACSP